MAVSSPGESVDRATVLARKAQEDATAVEEFAANSNVGDGIIGFHAQQAIEKWIKAVLAAHSVKYEYGHDLRYFIELIEGAGLDFPFNTPAVVVLSEYAVLRYEDLLDEEPLDRRAAVALVNEVGEWAAAQLRVSGD